MTSSDKDTRENSLATLDLLAQKGYEKKLFYGKKAMTSSDSILNWAISRAQLRIL